ncbi:hypothetical protein L596_004378 [Steinernema carpocapsae]|uniref:Uncharacterized protein n=1 Tax=Steinernema carpocapsae TaxID=34508 RepID=A0A4U8UX87_STECR|nr:hypothetical protein L596_004378 [Steinernema carpocapsae]
MNVHARSRSHCTLIETKTAKRRIRWMGFARIGFEGYRLHNDSDDRGVSDSFKTAIVRAFSSCVDARARADTHVRFSQTETEIFG